MVGGMSRFAATARRSSRRSDSRTRRSHQQQRNERLISPRCVLRGNDHRPFRYFRCQSRARAQVAAAPSARGSDAAASVDCYCRARLASLPLPSSLRSTLPSTRSLIRNGSHRTEYI